MGCMDVLIQNLFDQSEFCHLDRECFPLHWMINPHVQARELRAWGTQHLGNLVHSG